jgi:hypothetical protein
MRTNKVLRMRQVCKIRGPGFGVETFTCRKRETDRQQLLTPVILPTWEAEIRRILIGGLPEQKMFMRPPSLEKISWVWV